MAKDFFQSTERFVTTLNQTERQLFEYVVKNMNRIKDMSIQKFAAERYLSTTTIFRFTQKIGFTGYSDFINSLLVTSHLNKSSEIPEVLRKKVYSEEYLKNAIEAVRVMPVYKVEQVMTVLNRRPGVFILTDEQASGLGGYCERLFTGLGLNTVFADASHRRQSLPDQISDSDLLIALSYSGQDKPMTEIIERVLLDRKPFLLSVTRADNNILQNMSDVNFYVFADEIRLNGIELTSCVPMLMVLELLAYESIKVKSV